MDEYELELAYRLAGLSPDEAADRAADEIAAAKKGES
jgi:hypothetical protein